MTSPLDILLWNVNGLSEKKKRLLHTIIKIFNINIIFLVETHKHTTFNKHNWQTLNFPLENKGFSISFNSQSTDIKIIKSTERYISFKIIQQNKRIKGILIYGYSKKNNNQITWWKSLKLNKYDLVLGDFNITLNDADRLNPNSQHYPTLEKFIMSELKGHDDLAQRFGRADPTFFRNWQPISRIDYIFLASHFSYYSTAFHTIPNFEGSDHSILLSRIQLNKKQARGRRIKKDFLQSQFFISNSKQLTDPGNASDWLSAKHLSFDKIFELQKKFKAELCATKFKIIKILKKIPKNSKKFLKYSNALQTIIEEEQKLIRCHQSIGDVRYKDNPSKSLSTILGRKSNSSAISQIKYKDKLTSNKKEILSFFVDYYSNLYKFKEINERKLRDILKTCWIPPSIDYSNLMKVITLEELEESISKASPSKASGPDGFSNIIYRNINDNALQLLLKQMNDCLKSLALPNEWKLSHIVTFHKGGDKTLIDNRRPISLLNNDYKIFSRIIAHRLSQFINLLIDRGQVGFIPGRIPSDNIILLDILLKDHNNIIVNLDFKKAFDSISHRTLIIILEHLNFPGTFIQLITNMLSDCFAFVKIDDHLSDAIPLQIGVRQGDILSPVLFALAIEIFQKMALFYSPRLDPPVINNCLIPPLMYADDISFATCSQRGLDGWLELITSIKEITGLELNYSKSSIVTKRDITSPFTKATKFKYLGIHFDSNGIINGCKERINSIQNNLKGWHNPSFNIFQKLTIIKSYALPIINYDSFLCEIECPSLFSSLTSFLWKHSKRTIVSSSRSKKPMKFGGLDLWDLELRFKACRANTLEKLRFNEESKINSIYRKQFHISNLLKKSPDLPVSLLRFHKEWWECLPSTSELPNNHPAEDPDFNLDNYRSVKSFYQALCQKTDILDPKWTPRQLKLIRQRIPITKLFSNIKNLPNRKHADFMWTYLQGGLPFNHKKLCQHCNIALTYDHIFYKCNLLKDTRLFATTFINAICPSFIFPPDPRRKLPRDPIPFVWEETNILKIIGFGSKFHPLVALSTALLHAIWIIHCRTSHEGGTSPLHWISQDFTSAINALFQYISHSPIPPPKKDKLREQLHKDWKVDTLWKHTQSALLIPKFPPIQPEPPAHNSFN